MTTADDEAEVEALIGLREREDDEEYLVGEPAAFFVVTSKRTIAEDVIEFRLAPRVGESLPSWAPGAHIDLVLPSDAEAALPLAKLKVHTR